METDDTTPLSIGQLAAAAGVATSTIRFYERRGLLMPDARSVANCRRYTAVAAERLTFIRAAQAGGFSLNEVEEMLQLMAADGEPCPDAAERIGQRLEDIRARFGGLRSVEQTLADSLASLCKDERDAGADAEGV